jgi:hypothetical protein
MSRKERQNIGYKLNFVVVTIDNFLWFVFWTESGIRGDPDRVGTTRPDPEHESPSHRPLFLLVWPGAVSVAGPGKDFSVH